MTGKEGLVPLSDEQRCAEVGERPHEDEQGRGDDGRHAEWDHDGEEHLCAAASHVDGRLQERVVDVLQRPTGVEEHQREELEGEHEQDSFEAVDAPHLDADASQQFGEDSTAPHQDYPCIGSDEGSGHAAEDDQDLQQGFSLEFVHLIKIRKGNPHQERDHGCRYAYLEGVGDGTHVIALSKEGPEPIKGEVSVGGDDRYFEKPCERVDQDDGIEYQNKDGNQSPDISLLGQGGSHHSAPL